MITASRAFRTALLLLAVAGAAAGLAACGDDDNASGGDCATAEGGKVTIAEIDIKFDPDCLQVPAGEDVDIIIDNQDDGIQHNLHVKGAPDEPTSELEAGPGEQTLTVNLPEGRFDFLCDLHPAMTGTITAGPPPPPGN